MSDMKEKQICMYSLGKHLKVVFSHLYFNSHKNSYMDVSTVLSCRQYLMKEVLHRVQLKNHTQRGSFKDVIVESPRAIY